MTDKAFFNVSSPIKASDLAKIGDCQLQGEDKNFTGVAPLSSASGGDVTFLSNNKYVESLKDCKAGACVLAERHAGFAPENMILFISDNPYAAYARIAAAFYSEYKDVVGIDSSANIDVSAVIGKDCTIGANAVISPNVSIGDNTHIAAGAFIARGVKIGNGCHIGHAATLAHCNIGSHVIIHPGVRIGQDGFGFATLGGKHIKVPQLGRVIVEDDVEIGANSCIDRGAGPDTLIGAGTKIDNLVQIGHNVQIGKGCIIVSQVGISGSTKLGDYVVLGGQSGIAGHLEIGSMANVAAQSGVMQNIAAKEIVGGSPSVPIKQWHRQTIALKNLLKRKRENNG